MDRKRSERKQPGALKELFLPFQCRKRRVDLRRQAGGEGESVMPRKELGNGQGANTPDGTGKGAWVGRGVKRIQTACINQIAGKERAPRPLKKAAVSRRMAGRVKHLQRPAAQIDPLPVKEQLCRAALINLIGVQRKILRKRAGASGQILPDNGERQGEVS